MEEKTSYKPLWNYNNVFSGYEEDLKEGFVSWVQSVIEDVFKVLRRV